MTLALIDFGDLIIWTGCTFAVLAASVYGFELYLSWQIERERAREQERRRALEERRAEAARARTSRWAGAKRVVKRANRELGLKLHLRSVDARCPLCLDDVEKEVVCGGCQTSFHNECLDEMGRRCTTRGCGKHL